MDKSRVYFASNLTFAYPDKKALDITFGKKNPQLVCVPTLKPAEGLAKKFAAVKAIDVNDSFETTQVKAVSLGKPVQRNVLKYTPTQGRWSTRLCELAKHHSWTSFPLSDGKTEFEFMLFRFTKSRSANGSVHAHACLYRLDKAASAPTTDPSYLYFFEREEKEPATAASAAATPSTPDDGVVVLTTAPTTSAKRTAEDSGVQTSGEGPSEKKFKSANEAKAAAAAVATAAPKTISSAVDTAAVRRAAGALLQSSDPKRDERILQKQLADVTTKMNEFKVHADENSATVKRLVSGLNEIKEEREKLSAANRDLVSQLAESDRLKKESENRATDAIAAADQSAAKSADCYAQLKEREMEVAALKKERDQTQITIVPPTLSKEYADLKAAHDKLTAEHQELNELLSKNGEAIAALTAERDSLDSDSKQQGVNLRREIAELKASYVASESKLRVDHKSAETASAATIDGLRQEIERGAHVVSLAKECTVKQVLESLGNPNVIAFIESQLKSVVSEPSAEESKAVAAAMDQ